MRGRSLVALVMVAALTAAGCATDPTGSDASPAARPGATTTRSPTVPPSESSSTSPSESSSGSSGSPSSALPSGPSGSPTDLPTYSPSTTPTESPEPEESEEPLESAEESLAAEATEEECVVPARLKGQDVEVMPVDEKFIALTFDAGANADGVPSILATLLERAVPATFFLTGDFVVRYPVKSRRIATRHLVGNHTYDHLDLTTLTDLRITRQVRRAEAAILTTTGEDPRRFFRFPFGARDAHTIAVVNGLCYVPFRWTVDTLGWKGTSGGMSVDEVVARVLDAARPGAIVLMHVGSHPTDGSTLDADALPTIVRKLRLRGYTLVRLSRVLAAVP